MAKKKQWRMTPEDEMLDKVGDGTLTILAYGLAAVVGGGLGSVAGTAVGAYAADPSDGKSGAPAIGTVVGGLLGIVLMRRAL